MKGLTSTAYRICLILSIVALFSAISQATELLLTNDEINALLAEVYTATGLTFKNVPEIQIITDEKLAQIYDQEQDIIEEIVRKKGATVYYRSWANGSIAGKYSWLTGKVYLVKENMDRYALFTRIDPVVLEKIILTHEFVHAIDDQYYDLKGVLTKAITPENLRSVGALIEGHATLVSEQVYAKLGISPLITEKYQRFADITSQAYALSCWVGKEFITHVITNSNRTIADIFANPPLTTELVVEPEKYLSGYIPTYPDYLQVFGELFTQSLPWYFKNGSGDKIDKMMLMTVIAYMEGRNDLIKEYETGVIYQFSEKVKKKPDKMLPFAPNEDYSKGYLVICIYSFDQGDGGKEFLDFIKAESDNQFNTSNFTDPGVKLNQLKGKHPNAYVIVRDNENLGRLFYALNLVDSRHVVEILGCNLNFTELEIIKLLDEISKRLK